MSFEPGLDLKKLIGYSDAERAVWHAIVLEMIDSGGNNHDLDRLVTDSRKNRELVREMVRNTIGRIWRLTEKRVVLENEDSRDLTCSLKDFAFRHRDTLSNAFSAPFSTNSWNEGNYLDNLQITDYTYRLIHLPHLSLSGIFRIGKESVDGEGPFSFAGLRELTLYAEKVGGEGLSGRTIVAPAAHKMESPSETRVPIAYQDNHSGLEVSQSQIFTNNPMLGPSCFYLIREFKSKSESS